MEVRNSTGSGVFIVSVEWKLGSEVTGACCCYWGVEGRNSTGSGVFVVSVDWKVGSKFTGA